MDMTDAQVEMYKNMMNSDTLKSMKNMDMSNMPQNPNMGMQPPTAAANNNVS